MWVWEYIIVLKECGSFTDVESWKVEIIVKYVMERGADLINLFIEHWYHVYSFLNILASYIWSNDMQYYAQWVPGRSIGSETWHRYEWEAYNYW